MLCCDDTTVRHISSLFTLTGVCECMYVCACMRYICMHACVCVCVCVCVFVTGYVHVCVCICVCVCVCIYKVCTNVVCNYALLIV